MSNKLYYFKTKYKSLQKNADNTIRIDTNETLNIPKFYQ